MPPIIIRDLTPPDQPAARRLILAGLEEHWGWLDLSLNPDLDDISSSYAGETFLTAWLGGVLAGTGALVREADGVGRIVRMSVNRSIRRQGIGRALLDELVQRARQRGFHTLVLETTATWQDARGLYASYGFEFIEEREGDAHFQLAL